MLTVYIASPYSYKSSVPGLSWFMRKLRERQISKIAAKLTEKYNVALICPITQSARLADFMESPDSGFNYWKDIDLEFINRCDEVWIVKMKGWKESQGVQAEIQYALQQNKGLRYLDEKGNFTEFYGVHINDPAKRLFFEVRGDAYFQCADI